jgi:hypothetical protein
LKPKDAEGKPVDDIQRYFLISRPTSAFRLRVKLNDDRVVVLLDNKRALADFYSPYRLSVDNAESEFDCGELTIRTSIDW